MPTIKIPAPLRPYADGQRTLTLPGRNVAAILEEIVTLHPELKKHLYGDDTQLRPYVNLFLGDINIKELQGLDTQLTEGDTILIIPSIAGGKFIKNTLILLNLKHKMKKISQMKILSQLMMNLMMKQN